MIDRL